ncbi:MAG: N-6 DNA methylase [Planctomycetes bacterium]|nr:N-6 DNA methylase [Planctomycetota bacterium]
MLHVLKSEGYRKLLKSLAGSLENEFAANGKPLSARTLDRYFGMIFRLILTLREDFARDENAPGKLKICAQPLERYISATGELPDRFLADLLEAISPLRGKARGSAKKNLGVFYTPDSVIDEILDLASDEDSTAPMKILDPSCGGGAFLLRAFERAISDEESRAGPLPLERKIELLWSSFFGIDVDPVAVNVAKLTLLLRASRDLPKDCERPSAEKLLELAEELAMNVRCADALDRRFDPFPPEIRFDAVIGNPPYLSFSGRERGEFDRKLEARLARDYEAEGWLTLQGCFIERAVTDFSRRFVAFIVPDQIAHLAGYDRVRAVVTANAGLRFVRFLGEDVFESAVTPCMIFVSDRSYRGPARILRADGSSFEKAFAGNEPWTRGAGGFEIRVPDKHFFLGDLVKDVGVHTGNCASKLIFESRGTGREPVLEGRNVSRYSCSPTKKFIDLGARKSDGDYFRVGPVESFAGAKFLIRQTASRPIVGPREGAVYFRNSLLALYEPENDFGLLYVVALLNSERIARIYRELVHEAGQRNFPQVKIGSLRKLPLPKPPDLGTHDTIVALARDWTSLTPRDKCSELDGEIEKLVDSIYFGRR